MPKFDYKKIIVHGGMFHADDVLCVAMAERLNPSIKVERVLKVTDEMASDPSVIICDIGGGRYDHHQADAERREDGNKFAACGLFFRDFGGLLFPREESRLAFLHTYIIPLEDADNGVKGNPLSSLIHTMNGPWNISSRTDRERRFWEAKDFVQTIIGREIEIMESKIKAEELVSRALEQMVEGICVLDQYLPSEMFIGTDAKLLISPSLRGGWQLLTIKKERGSLEDVLPLPEAWLSEKPEGCTFVHQARFIASFDTKDATILAAWSIEKRCEQAGEKAINFYRIDTKLVSEEDLLKHKILFTLAQLEFSKAHKAWDLRDESQWMACSGFDAGDAFGKLSEAEDIEKEFFEEFEYLWTKDEDVIILETAVDNDCYAYAQPVCICKRSESKQIIADLEKSQEGTGNFCEFVAKPVPPMWAEVRKEVK